MIKLMTYILALLFLPIGLFSQITIKGKVLNSKTKEPVPYATIVWNRVNGTITDENGIFFLEIDSSLSDNDSLYISNLAYVDLVLPYAQVKDSQRKIFYLEPQDYKIPEIIITASKMKTKKYGIFKRKSYTGWNASKGSIIALKIQPKTTNGIIKNIQFYITDEGFNPTNKFRVHVYNIDNSTGSVGQELLPVSVITSASKGNEWVVVDITDFHIETPANGFFVGIEYLTNNKGDNPEQGPYVEQHNVQIGLSMENSKRPLTWSFMPNKQKWNQWKDKKESNKYFDSPNVNIASVILIEKKGFFRNLFK